MRVKPEQPLWDWLDRVGFPFRESRKDLIARFGARPCGWTDGLDYCEIVTEPLIPGLAHPIVFQFQNDEELSAHATDFSGYIRLYEDNRKNLDHARTALIDALGPGRDSSVANTIAHSWDFGWSRVEATTWPPDLNESFGRNVRHDKIPGSRTECHISITTGWRPPLTEDELAALKSYKALREVPKGIQLSYLTALARDWPDHLPGPVPGYGIAGDRLVQICNDGIIHMVPLDWIRNIERFALTPAKGGAEASLAVRYYEDGLTDGPVRQLNLLQDYGDPYALDDAAKSLAKHLNKPLKTFEMPNA